jgi:signal transduction histidine kinase
MTAGRTRLVALAALVAAAAVVALVLTSDREDAGTIWAVFGPAIGLSFVGTGLYAAQRRPESRTGELMVWLGFAWFVSALHFADSALLYTIALLAGGLWGAVFLHLVMAFPSGRLRPGLDRVLGLSGYVVFTIGSVPALLVSSSADLGCGECPSNLLLIERDTALAAVANGFEAVLYGVLFVLVLGRLVLRWRATPPLERLQLTPVYVCGLLTFLIVTAATAGGVDDADPILWAVFALTAALPAAFLGGLLRSRVAWLDAELRARLEDLRSSRARLVAAGDTERRRLERNLHDGAQARFVGLALLLGHARRVVDRDPTDPEVGALLDQALGELQSGLAELRELARGIHPPLLTEQGLEPALRALVARAPVPATLAADLAERVPPPVEIAAYFVVAEALANVGKYACASRVSCTVVRGDGSLRVVVEDDGVGGADVAAGTGLRGLADRVNALGGELRVVSPVDGGTVVTAEIPVGSRP